MTYFSEYGSPGDEITPEMRDEAEGKAYQMGVLKNSMRGMGANIVGFLGEALALKILRNSVSQNTFQHDILWCGLKGEIKTKDRQAPTKVLEDRSRDHECSVTNFNPNQRADVYIFASLVRIGATYKRGFLIGYYGTQEYKTDSHFLKEGTEFDTGVPNGITTDCHNMYHYDLIKFSPGMLK